MNREPRSKNDERRTENRECKTAIPFSVLGSPFIILLFLTISLAATNQEDQPHDEIQLKDGQTLRIAPLATFPGTPPKTVDPLVIEPLDQPGKTKAIPAGDIKTILYFETSALAKIEPLLKDGTLQQLATADSLLQELARFHDSRRTFPPLSANPWKKLRDTVLDKLQEVRRQQLLLMAQTAQSDAEWKTALRHADTWLSMDASLRDPVRSLWIGYGSLKLKEGDFSKVRLVLDHLDERFLQSALADPLRLALQKRAQSLGEEASKLPDDQAVAQLEEALTLWPHAPGLRDNIEKRRKNYRIVYVAVRQLPDNLSPATAFTETERQCLDLLFRRLVQVLLSEKSGQHYEADLAAELPRSDSLRQHLQLRRDAYWSDGDRVTGADVRHTSQLLETTSTWRDLLETPRSDGRPFALTFTSKLGLLDPLAPLRFYVLPQKYRGQPLDRADDPEFAKVPLGNGPFQYVERKQQGKRTVAVFRANPCYERQNNQNAVREVRLVAWPDIAIEQPPPHLVLDVPANAVADLKKMGYPDVKSMPGRRVYFLALNHRLPALANQDLRRALAHSIQRDKILQDHFRSPDVSAKLYHPLNGPFLVHSWAYCPSPRVPETIYLPEVAKSFARKAGQQLGPIRLTLKYPADEPGVKDACTALVGQISSLFEQVQVKIALELVPLSSRQMREALYNRDYELAYHHWDYPDDNFSLWPLFDPHPEALRPGGSNFLGYSHDPTLQGLLQNAMSHRNFPVVRDKMQDVHAHLYERMPLIPLWQLPDNFMIHPNLSAPGLDPRQVFLNILNWKVGP